MGYAADYHRTATLSTALVDTSTETLHAALRMIRGDILTSFGGAEYFSELLEAQSAIWTILDIRREN